MHWSRPARTEFLARRYLASRGSAPMVRDPLKAALPRLRQEASVAVRLARMDLLLALGLTLAGMLAALAVFLVPLHGGMLMVLAQLHLAPAAGVAIAIWAAVVLEKAGPRFRASRRIMRALQAGAMLEALELALQALPAPAAA
ncbi:hypothetical protein [Roseomonas marmotae]|uniref:Uncharacterized protein n=1 Tax=Roseomonas marmotae TaxID=2768161 RepID=A0ABS3KH64_9PROT|nr:hypothetical protein [Roseomonas marmotae]MBO1076816.1 hypothetical protein [Roseomonas marmotae]QTI78722.1 hypothetical protein IAI58_13790 [Roseomonas marmotae]